MKPYRWLNATPRHGNVRLFISQCYHSRMHNGLGCFSPLQGVPTIGHMLSPLPDIKHNYDRRHSHAIAITDSSIIVIVNWRAIYRKHSKSSFVKVIITIQSWISHLMGDKRKEISSQKEELANYYLFYPESFLWSSSSMRYGFVMHNTGDKMIIFIWRKLCLRQPTDIFVLVFSTTEA